MLKVAAGETTWSALLGKACVKSPRLHKTTHTHAHTLTTVPPRNSGSAALWRLFNRSKNKQKSLAAQTAPMVIWSNFGGLSQKDAYALKSRASVRLIFILACQSASQGAFEKRKEWVSENKSVRARASTWEWKKRFWSRVESIEGSQRKAETSSVCKKHHNGSALQRLLFWKKEMPGSVIVNANLQAPLSGFKVKTAFGVCVW